MKSYSMAAFIHKYRMLIALVGVAIIVSLVLVFGFKKTVTLSIDGQATNIKTCALRVGDLLHSQGITLTGEDQLSPARNAWLKNGQLVNLVHAIPIQVLADGKFTSLVSTSRKPSTFMSEAGLSLHPGDLLLSNGQPINPGQDLPFNRKSISLQVIRSTSFKLEQDGQLQTIKSPAPTLGSALWSAGQVLFAADRLSPSVNSPITSGLVASFIRSAPVTVHTQYGDVTVRTVADTVGEALQAAHLAPQGLDYSLPTSAEPIPADREIRLIRVSEQVLLEQTPIPFETEFQPVSDLDLDSQAVVQPGEYGISAQRVRIRYEDGKEASRQTDSQWIAREPQPRIIGYGTNVVMQTTTVDGVAIQYWRALSMYATSYHPSEVGDTTASGLPLKKGVAAVDTSIVPFYTELYIPGYGRAVAADIGGGVFGRMIDLGYSDSDYVSWHSTVTVYFLWPPPANIVWVVP